MASQQPRPIVRQGEHYQIVLGTYRGQPKEILICDWGTLVPLAAAIVRRYNTAGTAMTLRQLFYQMVSLHYIPNLQRAYKGLGKATADLRLRGLFPRLLDQGRDIHQYPYFADAEEAREYAKKSFRIDRTLGQKYNIYLGMEKVGLVELMKSWFYPLGLPILPLSGYSSVSYIQDVWQHMDNWENRENILIYAGDYDPSGEDIDRDFLARLNTLGIRIRPGNIHRVALTPAQVVHFGLPPMVGKAGDSRAAGFVERNGELVQVEVDALQPTDLRDLFQAKLDEFWDADAYSAAKEREQAERDTL